MPARLPYTDLSPEAFASMAALGHYLGTATSLEPVLLDLVRLLASLINGCEYCIHLHTKDLRKMNEPATRIDGVRAWRGSDSYTQGERAAFAWTEAVTNIQSGHAGDAVYNGLRAHFSDREIVDLTLAITTINAWNRIAIALGDFPGHAGSSYSAHSESSETHAPADGDDDGGKVAVDD